MKCPKCGGRYVEIHGSFCGSQKLQYGVEDGFDVVDSEPTDFEWDDDDIVDCLECGHEGSAQEFEAEVEEADVVTATYETSGEIRDGKEVQPNG